MIWKPKVEKNGKGERNIGAGYCQEYSKKPIDGHHVLLAIRFRTEELKETQRCNNPTL